MECGFAVDLLQGVYSWEMYNYQSLTSNSIDPRYWVAER